MYLKLMGKLIEYLEYHFKLVIIILYSLQRKYCLAQVLIYSVLNLCEQNDLRDYFLNT